MTLLAVLSGVVVLSPMLSAYNNGIGDSTEEYGCSTGCHTVQSSSVITMWSPNATPAEGETVTVIVNVTGGEASGAPLGVAILSALATSGSLPSNAGWTIVSDPTGGSTNNYHETPTYTGSVSWTWTLKAPNTAGDYTLYAREVHGNGDTFSHDFTTGLVFLVGSDIIPDTIAVIITSPIENSQVSGSLTVAASLIPSEGILYATLSIDGTLVDNKTTQPFSWTIDTQLLIDGTHVISVATRNASGAVGYDETTIVVNNSEAQQVMLNWVWTMVAGSVLMIALVAALIVIALIARSRKMDKKVN
ncbi:MAG: hypothetical protein A3K60_04315 [Euryarchaeota archaeon RBG_19FT_COMBO_56_21]|nr:MAG: hypothetical protein A3K60_04315 [Euryarchaeota archaeon RBG_19FT_COMBO_56_21]